jgi:CRP-like cAMP-binding protein
MPGPTTPYLALVHALAGLGEAAGLSRDQAEQLRPLCGRRETIAAGTLMEPAQRAGRLRLVTSGWLYEARLLPDGRRQIFGYLLAGDLVSARHGARTTRSDLFALTRVDLVELPFRLASVQDGAPATSAALQRALLEQEQRVYGAVIRLGQLSAQERTANLLVELRDRLARVGAATRTSFRVPLTQEHLADTLGLSLIHVNRVLRQMRDEGLLTIKFGLVTVLQPEKLERLAAGEAGR